MRLKLIIITLIFGSGVFAQDGVFADKQLTIDNQLAAQGASQSGMMDDEYLNICTFNIRHDLEINEPDTISWEAPTFRKNRVLDLISTYNFDLIGGQEVTYNQMEDILTLSYKDYGVAVNTGMRTSSGVRNAIFYKPGRFATLDQGTFWLSATPTIVSKGWDGDQNRNCSWLKLKDLNTNKIFFFFNAHFDHLGVEARKNAAKLIVDMIPRIAGTYPALFMGDLNSIETSEPIAILNAGLNDTRKISLTEPLGPYGTGHGWRIYTNVRRIDYIYTYNGNGSQRIEVQEYEVIDKLYDGKSPSDHWPVRVKIRLVPGEPAYVVTSGADDGGPGTLRQIVSTSQSGDSIFVDRSIVDTIRLAFPIDIDRSISLNGNGVVVQVLDPGNSAYRLFSLGANSDRTDVVSLSNLHLLGGDISGLTSANGNGGIMFMNKNVNLIAQNVVFEQGKAVYGGAIHCNDSTGVRIRMDNCAFINNEATNNAGAIYIKAIASLNECVFSGNKTGSNGSAITTIHRVSITDSEFLNNTAVGSGAYGGAIFNTGGGFLKVENSTFESNSGVVAGAGAFGCSASGTTTNFENCTFWGNSGVVASVFYNRTGTVNLVNCTVAGNRALAPNAPAYFDYNATNVSSNFINTIFAYNYSSTVPNDLSLASSSVTYGSHNLISALNQTKNLENTLSYASGEQNLFANYQVVEGVTLPVLDLNGGKTKTLALSGPSSPAFAAGIYSFPGFAVPSLDQRGKERESSPCVGAYEWVAETSLKPVRLNSVSIYPNPAQDFVNIKTIDNFIKAELYTASGYLISSTTSTTIMLNSLSKGTYFIKVLTENGISTEKIVVN